MKSRIRTLLIALAVALLFPILMASGLLRAPDNALADFLYQRPSATDGEIVLIGIDNRALDALGPLPWPRSYVAEAIECLNADPATAPAVIGVDVLYIGESGDPDADAYLADTAARGGNVVTASAVQFGHDIVVNGDAFSLDPMASVGYDTPYDALAAVTETGHINTMADADGYIRHTLLSVTTPDGEIVPSMARVLYERYAAYHGEDIQPPPETNENGFFYLPYTSMPGGYSDGISLLDLLEGTVDPAVFAGKIVLIGPYAAGLQDEYFTAIDHAAPMYGVEILANHIDAYRVGFYPEAVPALAHYVLLFAWTFLLVLLYRGRAVWTSVLIALVGTFGALGLCLLLYRGGVMLSPLWLPASTLVLFVASVAANYIRSNRERLRVTRTFGRYVDPAVLKELLAQGDTAQALGGTTREIAVLFVDIRGFTPMSESLPPETVVEILNRYLTLTTDCVMRYRGTLDKFVGDCTMAFWNAPLPQEDAVYLACRAAMDMVDGARALGEALTQAYGRTVRFGIGIHVGPAVVGNIGAPRRMDYTAIGDTVNTAARLEANAPGGKILISRAVADALGDRATTTSLGDSVKLKGKADGFEILTLDALRP